MGQRGLINLSRFAKEFRAWTFSRACLQTELVFSHVAENDSFHLGSATKAVARDKKLSSVEDAKRYFKSRTQKLLDWSR